MCTIVGAILPLTAKPKMDRSIYLSSVLSFDTVAER